MDSQFIEIKERGYFIFVVARGGRNEMKLLYNRLQKLNKWQTERKGRTEKRNNGGSTGIYTAALLKTKSETVTMRPSNIGHNVDQVTRQFVTRSVQVAVPVSDHYVQTINTAPDTGSRSSQTQGSSSPDTELPTSPLVIDIGHNVAEVTRQFVTRSVQVEMPVVHHYVQTNNTAPDTASRCSQTESSFFPGYYTHTELPTSPPVELMDVDDSSDDEPGSRAGNFYIDGNNYNGRLSYNDGNMYSDANNLNDPNNFSPDNNYNEETNYIAASSHSESDDESASHHFKTNSHTNKRNASYSESEDEESERPLPKKFLQYDSLATPVDNSSVKSTKAKAMMEKMGYKEGQGLGKKSQGRVNPIEVSRQRGRRGLGLKLPGLEPATLKWDSRLEVVKVEEDVSWLDGSGLDEISMNTLESWIVRDTKNLQMEGLTEFCDPHLLRNVLQSKSVFDSLDGEELRRARTRSNPFETIGKGIFQNRAAMKMANMDKVFDFMFTEPVNQNGIPQVGEDELLYFADVCAGPGGFSEYVLWRKKWRAKGFGFTLKAENDFKLSDFFSGPVESFEPYYGVKGDGNVFDPKNIESLMHFVMDQTDQLGVHFMMADGGFSVDGQENIQELLSKQLYLCQCLVALSIVRTGGHFVCKLFDVFSLFSVGIVYLMYRSFNKISIHKPNTSRPANSERYIICKWKRDDCDAIRRYMCKINEELYDLGNNNKQDITQIVSLNEIMADKDFYDYIIQSNNVLGERQIVNLIKIQAFCRDTSLLESRQAEIRKSCLYYWNVPDRARRADKRVPEEISESILRKYGATKFLTSTGEILCSTVDLENSFKSIYDWHCVPLGNKNESFFFLGLGRNKVFRLSSGGKYWSRVDNTKLELSPGTLVYGELIQEVSGESKSQRKMTAFHIIDAITLGEEDISQFHYTKRLKICNLYAKALEKPNRTEHCPIRIKQVYDLENVKKLFEGLTLRHMKSGGQELTFGTDSCAFQPKGVLFFRATRDPYTRFLSRNTGYHYYARPGSSDSKYDKDRPADACATVMDCMERRKLWWWENGVGLFGEDPKEGQLHKNQLSQFIHRKAIVVNKPVTI